jgi:hypothetical protein
MGLLAHAIALQQWPHHLAFEAAARDPERAQARVLRRLLRANRDTRFGREHGFADLGPADYARRVPLRDYEAFRPWVARAAGGEPGVLTAQPPVAFATTSGTTGEPKLVPVTPDSAAAMAGLMRLWTFYARRDHPAMLDHHVLTLVGPALEGRTSGGLPCGAMTGLAYQRLPWLIRRRHALPEALALVGDHERRYFLALRLALGQRISSIGTPNASTLLRLGDLATRRADALVRAIHDGSLGVDDVEPIPGAGLDGRALRATLAAGLRPAPERAAHLSRLAAARGRLMLGDCWPDLALLGCWLGGSAGIQARHLDEHFPRVPRRDLGLVASEGRLTVPLADTTAAGALAVHAWHFEFIAEEDVEAATPATLPCHALREGRRYDVVISGPNGLYRYDLNDVVEVRGFHHRTPLVAFVRKGRDMLSITGEKLHLNHAQAAVRAAERASGVGVWQFALVPDVEASRYDVLVEPLQPAGGQTLTRFLAAFDRALAAQNVEYAGKRASRRLGSPRLHVMRRGWSERLCRQDFAVGRRDVQHKWSAMRPEWDPISRAEVVQRVESPAPAALVP